MAMNKPTLRDLPSGPVEEEQNPLGAYVDSLPDKRSMFDGSTAINPNDPAHQAVLQQYVQATVQGLLNEKQVKKLMNRNPAVASILANALATQKLYKDKSGKIQDVLGSSFQPEESLPPDIAGPTRPESYNYQAAINRLNAMGETERADKLAEQWKRVQEAAQGKQQGLYGGVQYAFDPRTKQFVPYSIDERTRQSVPITPPSGTQAMIPVTPTPGVGPQGPGIYPVPNRAPSSPGGPVAVPGVTPMPTAEEAKATGSAETAFDMGSRLKNYVDSKKISVGPVEGRALRVKAALPGTKLTDEEADALSIEENLSNQLLQAMRGAQVGPMEQERFNRSLPRLDQKEALFKANIKTTMNNLETLQKRIASQRPTKPPTNAPSNVSREIDFSQLPKRKK